MVENTQQIGNPAYWLFWDDNDDIVLVELLYPIILTRWFNKRSILDFEENWKIYKLSPNGDKNIKWMGLRDEPDELDLVIHDVEEVW